MRALSAIWFIIGTIALLTAIADTSAIEGSAVRQAVVYLEFVIAVLILSFGGVFAGLAAIAKRLNALADKKLPPTE